MITMLKNYLKTFEKSPSICGPETAILRLHTECLITIMEKLELEQAQEPENTEPYITLMQFYEETHICHPNSISKLLTADPEFLRVCGKRQGKKYYIKLESTIKYLASCDSPRLSNSARKFLKKREQDKTQENICPIPNQLPLLPLPIN